MPAFHHPLTITTTIADNVTSPWTDEEIIFFPQSSGRSQKLRLSRMQSCWQAIAHEKLAHWDGRDARGLGDKCVADPDSCGGRGNEGSWDTRDKGFKTPARILLSGNKVWGVTWIQKLNRGLDGILRGGFYAVFLFEKELHCGHPYKLLLSFFQEERKKFFTKMKVLS